ncbi:transcription elongation factor [Shewanella psychropiezotolerans]|uniref:Transcription elongation factor n=1 Tax=Shewanella psychropiezotolerans TaxID=2593655 RepID=A0ABX5X0G1_9GAMM|nr:MULTISPECIES: GreA/GreB family elongation factor [Shewanella]MPY24675.1 transcription elongation factor [Shewanella sp. YLB-07]QDO83917.1 transcription elongation factor [Shewanella psychropiezotolerans]
MVNNTKFDKRLIVDRIISGLELAKQAAMSAAKQAHETATHSETVAKSKYETFGLEASYLAHGQAQRVAECEIELLAYRSLNLACFLDDSGIDLSALVTLEDELGVENTYFIGPGAPGMKIDLETDKNIDLKINKHTEIDLAAGCHKNSDKGQRMIIVITPSSPLGQSLMGRYLDDTVRLNIGAQPKVYEITGVE